MAENNGKPFKEFLAHHKNVYAEHKANKASAEKRKIGQQCRQLGTHFTQQEIFPRHRMILIDDHDHISAINKNHIWRMNIRRPQKSETRIFVFFVYAWI